MSANTEAIEQKRNRLYKLLFDHPGRQLESELGGLALSARTFDMNTRELLLVVERFENAFPNPLFQPGKRRELWEYSFEVVRFFQNAVASGESFLQHCCSTVKRHYGKDAFYAEFSAYYSSQIKGSAACMFVKQLRGFLLHRESVSPTVSRGVVDFSDPFDSMCSIGISTDAIEQERVRWERENLKAVEYLDKLRGTVNIRRLMYEYRATVKTFADWLLKREREINAKILAEYDALEAEIAPLRSALAAEEIAASRESLNIEESWLPDVDDPPTTI